MTPDEITHVIETVPWRDIDPSLSVSYNAETGYMEFCFPDHAFHMRAVAYPNWESFAEDLTKMVTAYNGSQSPDQDIPFSGRNTVPRRSGKKPAPEKKGKAISGKKPRKLPKAVVWLLGR